MFSHEKASRKTQSRITCRKILTNSENVGADALVRPEARKRRVFAASYSRGLGEQIRPHTSSARISQAPGPLPWPLPPHDSSEAPWSPANAANAKKPLLLRQSRQERPLRSPSTAC